MDDSTQAGLHHQWELEMQQQEMTLVSEYKGNGVKARVYRRPWMRDWVTVCYDENGFERLGIPHPLEEDAENCAEDWVID